MDAIVIFLLVSGTFAALFLYEHKNDAHSKQATVRDTYNMFMFWFVVSLFITFTAMLLIIGNLRPDWFIFLTRALYFAVLPMTLFFFGAYYFYKVVRSKRFDPSYLYLLIALAAYNYGIFEFMAAKLFSSYIL